MTSASFSEVREPADCFAALANLDQDALDALTEAVYLCARDGQVVRFNRRAAELWGRTPKAGDPLERFCGSFRLYRLDGTLLPHDQCPVADVLQNGGSVQEQEVVIEQPNGRRLTVRVNIAALKDTDGRVSGAINCFTDVTARKQAQDRERQLLEEFKHRLKNTLATVRSLAANTARGATSIDEFTSRFEARLLALDQAHTLLSDSDWSNAKLRDLLGQQLAPFLDQERPRIAFEGPDIELSARLASALSLIFHELLTNAAKHGALSAPEGRIAIEWDLLLGPSGGRSLRLEWVETNGPRVEPPERTGFGSRAIRATAAGLGGEVNWHFEPSGLRVLASVPL